MEKTPATTAKRLNSPRQLRALIALQQGPQTVRSLQDRAGGNTIPELVAALRRKGLVILTEDRCGQDRDGRTVSYGTYNLSPESAELADELIEEFVSRGA